MGTCQDSSFGAHDVTPQAALLLAVSWRPFPWRWYAVVMDCARCLLDGRRLLDGLKSAVLIVVQQLDTQTKLYFDAEPSATLVAFFFNRTIGLAQLGGALFAVCFRLTAYAKELLLNVGPLANGSRFFNLR